MTEPTAGIPAGSTGAGSARVGVGGMSARPAAGVRADPARQRYRPWSEAMQDALYGPQGFWLRQAPADHVRTSAGALAPTLARAVRELARRVDDSLGRPDPFDLVDVGAGRGELLSALADVPARWRLTAVERAPDPGLPGMRWTAEVPALTGLLIAHEWLDDVPVEVLFDGRVVGVAADGAEALLHHAGADSRAWAARWWPHGRRVEVGRARDEAWAAAVARVRRGVAVAVDYGHLLGAGALLAPAQAMALGDRRPTLTGYRDGRQVPPLPDGSCNLTAHVAIDAVREAGGGGSLHTQREALVALGLDPTPPPRALATTDPRGYLAALQDATRVAELLNPRSLGGFAWLVRPVGVPDPLAVPVGARVEDPVEARVEAPAESPVESPVEALSAGSTTRGAPEPVPPADRAQDRTGL